jgi:superfamily II RNA helicase
MSGRAGRRGMDEIGYVTIVGSAFQSPEEVAELVLSDANPLESKFSPSYSMVLNLLQRFSLEEAKELVLKSFGYYSSSSRIEPLLLLKDSIQEKIDECNSFTCYCKRTNEDLLEYNKIRDMYVQQRRTFKTIQKQEKKKHRELTPEAIAFGEQTKSLLNRMHSYECDNCKLFKKHMKNIDILLRYNAKQKALDKEIEKQKDIFWNKFLSHRAVLAEYNYLKDDYPTEGGVTISQIRSENELFLAQVIFSGILESLTPAELASVICALTTEDMRADLYSQLPLSGKVRKTLNKIKDIKRDLDKKQKNYEVTDPMYINAFYSPLIEMWVNGAEWDTIINEVDMGEGDIVRSFKRVIDVLRQFCTISNVPEPLVFTAREAINLIQRSPIDVD